MGRFASSRLSSSLSARKTPGLFNWRNALSAGRGAIGKTVEKGQLLATIADETTARQLKQARADLQAATQRAELPLPSAEALKVAEDNLSRLDKLTALSNVPAVEYEKARSEVNRLRGLLESERIERDRNLAMLEDACKKLEAQMKNSEIRSPMDGLLTAIKTIDGELVADRAELFTISSRKNYVRGEVDEEDVGEVKVGMEAVVQVYAFRTRQFSAKVSAIQPAADPETQRYTIVLDLRRSAREPDGRHDGRDEHHHRHARECSSAANARPRRRSSAHRETRHRPVPHRQGRLSHARFF